MTREAVNTNKKGKKSITLTQKKEQGFDPMLNYSQEKDNQPLKMSETRNLL